MSEPMANILIVVVQKNGHTINAAATNDESGVIYAEVGAERIRFPRDNFANVKKQTFFDVWETCTDVSVVAVYNKNLDEAPDVSY